MVCGRDAKISRLNLADRIVIVGGFERAEVILANMNRLLFVKAAAFAALEVWKSKVRSSFMSIAPHASEGSEAGKPPDGVSTSHLPPRFNAEAGFGTWSPVSALAGRVAVASLGQSLGHSR